MVLYTATIHILLLYVLLIFRVTIFIMQHNIKWNCFFKITVFRKTLSCFYKSTLDKTNGFFRHLLFPFCYATHYILSADSHIENQIFQSYLFNYPSFFLYWRFIRSSSYASSLYSVCMLFSHISLTAPLSVIWEIPVSLRHAHSISKVQFVREY